MYASVSSKWNEIEKVSTRVFEGCLFYVKDYHTSVTT